MAQINLIEFFNEEQENYITCRKHPFYDLFIWNYTAKTQYERHWNEVTLQARGLITDLEGNIIARPFQKFFNYEEVIDQLPLEPFQVTNKLDGSLGILYFVDDQHFIATRGSFTSEQSIKANQILKEKYSDYQFNRAYTYLFEIIYPENRIVVDYGLSNDIFLLAMINIETGEEFDIQSIDSQLPFTLVRHYNNVHDLASLKVDNYQENAEGFVIRFESGFRVKIKFDEYVRLHRILTQVNAKMIWEYLRENNAKSMSNLLEKVPDEFYIWVKNTTNDLLRQYHEIENWCLRVYEYVSATYSTRKEQALHLQHEKYNAIIFRMLDNKDYTDLIWKMIKPKAEKPFKEEI